MSGWLLEGAEVLLPGETRPRAACVALEAGRIAALDPEGWSGRRLDLAGHWLLPGIVDAHGDGFERHVAPRRGAVSDLGAGLRATEAELAACGITTAVLAQFWSWEGGMRGPDFARRLLAALEAHAGLGTDLRAQLRFETHLLDDYAELRAEVARRGVGYVVFNDHLPHRHLAEGRKVPRLTGQALKSGRSPEAHRALLQALHDNGPQVPAALDALAEDLRAAGVLLGSHDDAEPEARALWRHRGATVAEFPETRAAAEAARAGGDAVVMGAPNVLRGGSHKGNVDALELAEAGLCDALASDYHYPAPALAALKLASRGALDMGAAWGLVSAGPAALLGLADRGVIAAGRRADLVVYDPAAGRIAATLAGGRVTHLAGPLAGRLLG